MNDLEQLIAARDSADASDILRALREGLAADPASSGPAEDLHRLLQGYFELDRMASDRSFAAAFRRYPETAARLLAILEDEGATEVAALVRSLMSGRPKASGALNAGLRHASGLAASWGDGIRAALAGFAQVALADDASAAEIELGVGWSVLEEALLDRVQAASADLAFSHGITHRQAVERDRQLDALAAAHDIPALLCALMQAQRPRIVARHTEWDIEHAQAPAEPVEIAVAHRAMARPLGPAAALPESPAGAPLRALYGCVNGAELFVPRAAGLNEPGLVLLADADWQDTRERMRVWLSIGRSAGDLPDWADSLLPFAMTPGDASVWVTPLEGPLAGTVMRSNDDVAEAHARYRSLAHFLAALRLFPQEVLGVAGHVSYLREGSELLLYPVGYREDGLPA